MVAPLVVAGVAAGGLVLAGVGLRLRALAKKKGVPVAGASPAAIAAIPPVPGAVTAAQRAADPGIDVRTAQRFDFAKTVSDAQIDAANAASAAATGIPFVSDEQNKLDFARELGVTPEVLDAAAAIMGLSTKQFLLTNDPTLFDAAFAKLKAASEGGSTAGVGANLQAAVGSQKAIVTTSDPAPSGDLIIRSAPAQTAGQIGGAEKNGTVTIINSNTDSAGIFAEIDWGGGSRLGPARGFAKKQFLKLL